MPRDASQAASGRTRKRAPTSGSFDSDKARKAAQERWSQQRAKPELPEATASRPDSIARVVSALRKKAEAGDVNAAREYRAWLAEHPEQAAVSVDTLERRQVEALLQRLVRELEEEEAANT